MLSTVCPTRCGELLEGRGPSPLSVVPRVLQTALTVHKCPHGRVPVGTFHLKILLCLFSEAVSNCQNRNICCRLPSVLWVSLRPWDPESERKPQAEVGLLQSEAPWRPVGENLLLWTRARPPGPLRSALRSSHTSPSPPALLSPDPGGPPPLRAEHLLTLSRPTTWLCLGLGGFLQERGRTAQH